MTRLEQSGRTWLGMNVTCGGHGGTLLTSLFKRDSVAGNSYLTASSGQRLQDLPWLSELLAKVFYPSMRLSVKA